jgi:hypothetical protein
MTTTIPAAAHLLPNGVAARADGSCVVSGAALEWFKALDTAILELAGRWSPVEYQFPPVVPARDLERIDYFHSFPHLLTVPASLPRDASAQRRFAANSTLDADGALPIRELAPIQHALTPAACYPIYPTFDSERLTGARFVTVRATCFRKEEYFVPLRRQWTFSMREVVCIGSSNEVTTFLDAARGVVDTLMRRLGLTHDWMTATDPFFEPSRSGPAMLQRLSPVKVEAVVDELAISSVNLHHQHFGDAFGIGRGDEPAHSGCLAFGLDRWLGVVADRWGSDPAAWPNPRGGVLHE